MSREPRLKPAFIIMSVSLSAKIVRVAIGITNLQLIAFSQEMPGVSEHRLAGLAG
jgi:hypothetical protein